MTKGALGSVCVAVWLGCFTAPTHGQQSVDCKNWNTNKFFEKATVENVTACINAGADLEARDKWKYTPLHLAAAFNQDPAVIEALLRAGADLEARDYWKRTPLHLAAAFNQDPAVIEALLKGGADLEARDDDKDTPLHEAARSTEDPAVIEALLKAGADLETRDKNGNRPLHAAGRTQQGSGGDRGPAQGRGRSGGAG